MADTNNNKKIAVLDVAYKIKKNADPWAILLFGSYKTGKYWPESDIDLFIITNKSKEPSAFYARNGGIMFHCNVSPTKRFKAALNNPLMLIIHALFVDSDIIYAKTPWPLKKQEELLDYPLKNKLYQVIDRIDSVLMEVYKLRKHMYFKTKKPFLNDPVSLLLNLFEIEAIDRGIYFGRSVTSILKKKDLDLLDNVFLMNPEILLQLANKRIKPFIDNYVPWWIDEVKKKTKKASYKKLYSMFQFHLEHVYHEAFKLSLIEYGTSYTRNHGFPVEEQVIIFK